MEKGFNEDELADIMSEIETLEQDFVEDTSEVQEVAEPQQEDQNEEIVAKEQHEEKQEQHEEPEMQEPEMQDQSEPEQDWEETKVEPIQAEAEDSEVDEEMNEVLDELSQMPVEDVTPQHTKQDDNVHHIKEERPVSVGSKSQTAMSFHVEGDMKLELSFHIGDQFIGVNITEEGLVVGLDGGAKFTIPINTESHSNKKAA